ncbi:MAG: leucine-rich repeat domain-containing protein [Patescibacteria group bacterium]
MNFSEKKAYFFIILLISVFAISGSIKAEEEEEFLIKINTLAEEAVSLSASWRPGGFANWHFVDEEPIEEDNEDDEHLIYKNRTGVDHFFGRAGEKEIHMEPSDLDRINRITWSNQSITGEIPENLTKLEDFYRLNLSHNNLEGEIPEYIQDFTQLRWLILDNNNLEGEIPAEMEGLENVEVLSLHNNNLEGEIPAEIGSLTNLQELYLHNNNLTSFANITPTEEEKENSEEEIVRDLSNLKILTLNNNSLENLPEEIIELENLYTLNVRANSLNSLFDKFNNTEEDEEVEMKLNKLEHLNAANNLLNCGEDYNLPQELGDLSSLQDLQDHHTRETWHPRKLSLDLRYNCLTLIPESIGDLAAIDSLRLDNNNIQGFSFTEENSEGEETTKTSMNSDEYEEAIPPSIKNLSQFDNEIPFTLLSLYNNNLEGEIPAEIGELSNLKTLRLHNNNLEGEIPAEVFDLDKLTTLNIENNELELSSGNEGEEEEDDFSATADNLQWLFASRNEIESIPEELKLSRVRFAYFSENKIEKLPEEFGDNFGNNLQELSLNKNLLESLPESFRDLDSGGGTTELLMGSNSNNLINLELGTNLLEEFPVEVTNLSNLKYLNLSRQAGQAKKIRSEIQGQMSGAIPQEITELSSLETLLINNNSLESLPEENWSNMSNLTYLYGQNNNLENLPAELGDLNNLKRLYLNNNNISQAIPGKIMEAGNLRRAYFQYNEIDGSLPNPDSNNWSSLNRFFADENEIGGGLNQKFLEGLSNVEYFSMYENELDGQIDSAIENMGNLRWFDVALNQGRGSEGISGPLPSEIENLTSLETFNFNNNAIEEVPDELNSLSNLENIYGFENQIDSFASNIEDLNNLVRFDFHTTDDNNKIPFPEGAEELKRLEYFSLGENKSGEGEVDWEKWVEEGLPEDVLSLNNNDFKGDLPDEMLNEVNKMNSFNIRNNDFKGEFPDS